ncbi:MAG: DUF2062 domain-containing protein [Bacteroidales bacterium]|nr:DUF2062 domain-containing protein [Bacteroidales bacterium]
MIAKPVKNILKKRLLFPLVEFLKQGMSPQKLSLMLCLGLTFGVVPFIGVNTILLIILAIIFRLNIIAIQIVNYFVYPLQIILYIPFMKVGQFIFNGPEISFSSREFILMLKDNWFQTITDMWFNNFLGIIVWLILAIPTALGIYYFSLPVFKRYTPVDI